MLAALSIWRNPASVLCLVLASLVVTHRVPGQNSNPTPSPTPISAPKPSLERKFFINVVKDQYGIWTYPFRLKQKDLPWALPLAGATAVFLATDEQTAHLVS